MKKFVSYRDESKVIYGRRIEEGEGMCLDQLKLGALQRIADAIEAIAKNHVQLMSERTLANERNMYERRCRSLERSIASLRGYITKLHKRTT